MLSILQTQKLTHFFNILDQDKNGMLQIQDFEQVGQNVCSSLCLKVDTSAYDEIINKCRSMFHNLITSVAHNNHDFISPNAWLTYFDLEVITSQNRQTLNDFINLTIDNLFEIYDQNGDGEICLDEYIDMFTVYGITASQTAKSFPKLDTDGNETISKEELQQAMKDFFVSDDPLAKGNWVFGMWN
ncbi:MAG: EF-hand domain-containing protein [Cyclobacteriaceae bacterium]